MTEIWQPDDRDSKRTYDVFVDESSQTKAKYLIIGALIVPYTHRAEFDADMLAAREGTKVPTQKPNGDLEVLKWENCNKFSLDACINTAEAVYRFKKKHNLPVVQDMRMNCLAVDTHRRPTKRTGEGDPVAGLEKEFYFLGGVSVAKRFRGGLFRVFPDRSYSRKGMSELQGMFNAGAAKHDHRNDKPFRHLDFGDPEGLVGLQVVDLFIGALAYRLNGRYDAPDANAAKKKFCDHIWPLFKLGKRMHFLVR